MTRLLRHPAVRLGLLAAVTALAVLAGWSGQPALAALAAAAFVAAAAWMLLTRARPAVKPGPDRDETGR